MALLSDAVNKAINPFKEEIKATVADIKAEVSGLDARITTSISNIASLDTKVLGMVDTLTNKYSSSYGHITKTTLPSLDDKTAALATQLDILEARIMAQPPTSPETSPPDLTGPSPSIMTGATPSATTTDHDPGPCPVVLEVDNPGNTQPTNVMANTLVAYAAFREQNSDGATCQSPASSAHAQSGRPVTPYPSSRRPPPLRQTTIPKTLGWSAGLNATGEDAATVVGGPIVSPCHSNRAMHARTLGASCFDIIKLATKEYHVSMDGVVTLSKELIQECGYGTIKASVEDVVVCYNNIIMVHHRVHELWYNSHAHTMGPQVDKILSKLLTVFPKLTTLRVEDVVNFYDRLQEVSINHAIALMPFDAVVLSNRFEGLCPPGLGLLCYAAMCKALMELLPWVLHGTISPQVKAALALVRYETGSGYDYLWHVLELTIPGFDPTVPIQAPTWTEVEDIFQFAQDYLLFFRLQAKLNFHYDDHTRSGFFLRAVQYSQFADTVTLLQSHVDLYRQEFEDGYLPPNLCLHGLANSIHQNAQARLWDIATPCARRVKGDFTHVQGLPLINCFAREERPCSGFGNKTGGNSSRDHGRTLREPGGRFPRGLGCLACPNHNRRPFLPNVQCTACRRVGHVAKHCDMLVTAICLEKYIKHDMSPGIWDSIEKEWLDWWKECLGNPSTNPCQVLRSYVEDLGITVAGLDAEMDWDCWVEDDLDISWQE